MPNLPLVNYIWRYFAAIYNSFISARKCEARFLICESVSSRAVGQKSGVTERRQTKWPTARAITGKVTELKRKLGKFGSVGQLLNVSNYIFRSL